MGIFGNQRTIVAGGRYDGLVESLGGPATPAVGFALGVERAVLSLLDHAESYRSEAHVFIVSRGEQAAAAKLSLAAELRGAGLYVELEHRSVSMKAQFKRADKLGAQFVITISDEELENNSVKLKNMSERSEKSVPRAQIGRTLAKLCGE